MKTIIFLKGAKRAKKWWGAQPSSDKVKGSNETESLTEMWKVLKTK